MNEMIEWITFIISTAIILFGVAIVTRILKRDSLSKNKENEDEIN